MVNIKLEQIRRDFLEHKNEEIFLLEIFQFNGLFLRYIKEDLKKQLCTTVLEVFVIIFIYYYDQVCIGQLGSDIIRCVLGN